MLDHDVLYGSCDTYELLVLVVKADLGEEEQTPEELPECPDHRSTSFLKGKPWSILSLPCFKKYYLSPLCLMH